MLPDLIKTERLLLRPWRFGDVGEVYAHAQDDAWSRFLPVPRPYGERDAETFIAAQLLLDREQHPSWAIESAGQLVGGIHLQVLALGRIREMGYSVARSHWGTGIATEASLGVISEAFRAEPQLARIQASVCPENLASVRVLEKLGMSREGILRRATLVRDTLLDQAWYGLLREDWGEAPLTTDPDDLQMSSRELREQAWIEVADLIDRQLSPLGLAAMDALAVQPGQTILDIGCGTGQTLRQLAERVGPSGRVIGVDIAPRLLQVARSRTCGLTQVQLVLADAATLALPDDVAEGVFSRFGVMALDDSVAAFTGFRRMTRRGGRLGFVCWRSLVENELDHLPLQAAELDAPIDGTPFKFERRDHIADVLESAGFRRFEIEAADTLVTSGNLDAMATVLTRVGPLGKILRERPLLRSRAEPRVRSALMARAKGSGDISLKAATWVVTATA